MQNTRLERRGSYSRQYQKFGISTYIPKMFSPCWFTLWFRFRSQFMNERLIKIHQALLRESHKFAGLNSLLLCCYTFQSFGPLPSLLITKFHAILLCQVVRTEGERIKMQPYLEVLIVLMTKLLTHCQWRCQEPKIDFSIRAAPPPPYQMNGGREKTLISNLW